MRLGVSVLHNAPYLFDLKSKIEAEFAVLRIYYSVIRRTWCKIRRTCTK